MSWNKIFAFILWSILFLSIGILCGYSLSLNVKSNNIDIVTANTDYEEKIPIYSKPNSASGVIGELCGQTSLTCNLYGTQKIINGFIKVELSDHSYGYIKKTDCFYDTLYLENIENEQRKEVCQTAIKYLGTPYLDMQCNELIYRSFLSIKKDYQGTYVTAYNSDKIGKKVSYKELQPGDIVFYDGLTGTAYGHIGLYLGQGYVIQSTTDQGSKYPLGGVHITKLSFRSKPTAFRSPF